MNRSANKKINKTNLRLLALVVTLLMMGISFAVKAQTPSHSFEKTKVSQPVAFQKVLILLGAPGSGKGTQAALLSKELNLPHISTGDLFRENLKQGTELGKKAKGYMEAGQLVPDEIVQDMLFKRIAEPDAKAGYLLDGFPRTIAQAEALEAYLKTKDKDKDEDEHKGGNKGENKAKNKIKVLVINLNAPESLLIERIVKRGKANEGKEKRSDDTAEIAKKRLEVYHKETEPLIHYYEKKGVLVTVESANEPKEVMKKILVAYKKAMSS